MGDTFDLGQVGKVLQVQGSLATVDLGGGTTTQANIALTDAKVGDFVLIHAGYVMKIIDIEQAQCMLSQWR